MTTTKELATWSVEELKRRRGELAQGLQMAALEGLPFDEEDIAVVGALDAELARRGRTA
jgi:predicted nucleic acid-binding protein